MDDCKYMLTADDKKIQVRRIKPPLSEMANLNMKDFILSKVYTDKGNLK